jgi:3',5'-cyclic AMP phosphodiesterase CpdA
MQFKDTPLSSEFQRLNVKTILRHVEELDVDHILVTGDLTNYAQQNQFESVKAEFMAMQAARGSRPGARPSGRTELDPTFWTILPGNHDVTNLKPGTGYEKANLGMFFDAFGSTYNKDFDNRNHDLAFPVAKNIPSRNGSFSVRLIGLDSNVREPVWHVGVNARGKIDSQQMGKLQRELPKENSAALTLVALHHHPIVVVELGSKLEDYFLSLKESQGRELIKLCAHMKVAAILHGHFHAFSSWSGLTPQNTHMAIIGSSAGTLVVPGTQEEFLELREADLVTQGAEQHGLALYAHQLMRDGKWGEKYTDIFLPVLAQG